MRCDRVDIPIHVDERRRAAVRRQERHRGLGDQAVADAKRPEQPVTAHRVERIHSAERNGSNRAARVRRGRWGIRRRRPASRRHLLQHCRPLSRLADPRRGAAATSTAAATEGAMGKRRAPARCGQQSAWAVGSRRGHAAGRHGVREMRGPVGPPEIGVDREQAVGAPAEEGECLEAAIADEAVLEDRLGQRLEPVRLVLECRLPQETELALLDGSPGEPIVGLRGARALCVGPARRPLASLRVREDRHEAERRRESRSAGHAVPAAPHRVSPEGWTPNA